MSCISNFRFKIRSTLLLLLISFLGLVSGHLENKHYAARHLLAAKCYGTRTYAYSGSTVSLNKGVATWQQCCTLCNKNQYCYFWQHVKKPGDAPLCRQFSQTALRVKSTVPKGWILTSGRSPFFKKMKRRFV